MPKDDLVYVGHMIDTVRLIASKLVGKARSDFDADENLRLAVAHLIQTIGESARRVSSEFQRLYPQVPWSRIIGMQHKVVHDYLNVDFDIVWGVATTNLPALALELEKIVPPIAEP